MCPVVRVRVLRQAGTAGGSASDPNVWICFRSLHLGTLWKRFALPPAVQSIIGARENMYHNYMKFYMKWRAKEVPKAQRATCRRYEKYGMES